ncbi:MAG: ATP-binding protein [Burkholderiales bacterium]
MNIRASIFGMVVAVVLTALGLSYALTRDLLTATVNERELEKVRTVGAVVESLVQEYAEGAQLAARALRTSDRLTSAMTNPDTRSSEIVFAVTLQPLLADGYLDSIEVVDDREIIRYRAQDPAHKGDQATPWGITEALQGNGSLVAHTTAAGSSLLAIEPLRQGNTIVGAVMVGRRLNATFIKNLRKKVNAELALISRSTMLASSSDAILGSLDKSAVEEAFQQKIPVFRSAPDGKAKVVYMPLLIVDEGFVMMVRVDSTSAFDALAHSFRVVILWTMGFLLTCVLGTLLLLKVVLSPLRRLRIRAEQMAVEATGHAITSKSSDEIASVVEVLDTLTGRLLSQNQELSKSQARAGAANEAKSNFLSTMSHEIRTPLNGILGMADLLKNTNLDDRQRRFCEAIEASGNSLHALLSGILDLSKIEAGKIEIENIDFELKPLLATLAAAFADVAASRSNTLSTAIDVPSPGIYRGDPTRLTQVLNNLIGNAIKFTEGGNIMLAISTEFNKSDSRTWLRFTVRDSGVGVDPERLKLLFKPFVQADSSITRKFGGTGLGLAISKHLVELMGGTMNVESTPGAGSHFWFDLPFEAAQAYSSASPNLSMSELATLDIHVLLAEDNEINQEIAISMLESVGAKVTAVENGKLAVQAMRDGKFDLIMLDCQMPVMSGYDAATQIRAEEKSGCHIPIVALTANAFAEDRDRCVAAGMDDYLTKPVKREILVKTLARWVTQPPFAKKNDGTP